MSAQEQLQNYLRLAHQYEQAGQSRLRDRCLELAIDLAWQSGRVSEAERLWNRLKHSSPHVYLCGFSSLSEAMQRPEVKEYLNHARQHFAELPGTGSVVAPPRANSATNQVTSGELSLPLDTRLMRDSEKLDNEEGTEGGSPASAPPNLVSSVSELSTSRLVVTPRRPDPSVSVSLRRGGAFAPASSAAPAPGTTTTHRINQNLPSTDDWPGQAPDLLSVWVAGGLAVLVALLMLALVTYVVLAPFLPR
ncbi:MAG: hypothetical protein RMI91_02800 [Gemmatales bacterium]|nr:hypothetical protein [Gemmatales bacterium]MDW7993557.1 hypothetical protein [Gemmatales bacterium]